MSPAARPASGLFSDPRPVTAIGDLFANIWQVAYVTDDLDRAMEDAKARLGVEQLIEVPTGGEFYRGDELVEWNARIAMGARGGLIFELIQPVSGEIEVYTRYLPANGGLGFHHFAAFLETGDDAWDSLKGVLAEQGLGIDYTLIIPGRVRAGYIDTSAQLGHFLEVCQLQPDDIQTFSGLVEGSA
jgi:hypothetical protein